MPGLTSLPLNLSEILEARRGPLRELEIWALLCQCSQALQDLIIKGQAGGENAFRHMVTPNTLLVKNNGTIQLSENVQSPQNSLYMAPEYGTLSGHFVSDAAFEKMFLFSLGRTLQVASEFGLQENEVLSISSDLDSLLQAMSERNAAVRLSLLQVLEACCLQTNQHPDKLPHSLVLSRLYKSILGGHHKRSFNDSNYGSDQSHEAVMSHQPGRARRPRPQVRHRHARRKRGSTSSTSSPNSRSRSRSRSPSRRTAIGAAKPSDAGYEVSSMEPGGSLHKGEPLPGATATSAHATLTGSQLLNTSMTSTSSELSLLARRQQAPPYSAAHSVQGLLGLRQGSPAYQKYIRLKERQIRRRQAKSGQTPSALDDVRSRLMTPPLLSSEMMENISESHSMASLMSYTLGAYKPYLHAEFGSEAALNFNNESGPENESQMSYLLSSMDYGYPSSVQAHAVPGSVVQEATRTQRESLLQEMSVGITPGIASEAPVTRATPDQYQNEASADVTKAGAPQTEYYAGKQRDFDGSEYAHNLKKPAVLVPMPLQGDSLKNATLARRVTVIHLSGQKFEIVLDPSSSARQLFDTVIPYLELDDFFFFGLTYVSEGEHFFLDADMKLNKVAPEGWKEGSKGHQAYVTFSLYVRVKFYPESVKDFRHVSSHHLLYLQLRRDVLEERVMIDPDLLFKLAGLALQAECGDFSKDKSTASGGQQQEEATLPPYFNIEHYIPGRVLKQTGSSVVDTKVRRRHKATAGLPRSQAEFEFVKLVQSLPEYGIHFYKLSKSKNQPETIWVGLSQHNMAIAEPTATAARSVTQCYTWNNILKISFNKRRFSVQPKVEGARGKPPKINFYTNSYRKGRYLLQFSAEQHRFEIRMKTFASAAEPPTGTAAMETSQQAVDPQTTNTAAEVQGSQAPTYVDPALQKLPDDDEDDDELDEDWDVESKRDIEQPPQYRSWPPYQLPRMAQILGGEISPLHASLTDLHSLGFDKQHLQTLLDVSSATQGLDSVSVSDQKKMTGVFAPPNLSLMTDESPVGRRIFEVTLEKEKNHGVGITIVGGETTSSLDLGIFVKSVVPGGPAERDGRIKCGDRLIAIGTTSLEGKQHHEAVAMIRDSGPMVTFLVSQVRPPGTVKRRSQSVSEKELEKKQRDSMLEYRHSGFGDPGGGEYLSRLHVDDKHMNESLLGLDHFVSNRSLRSESEDDDEECHSDEENYPLEPSPPYLSLSPTAPRAITQQQQHFQYSQPQHYETLEQRVPSPSSPELNNLHLQLHSVGARESHLVPDMMDGPVEQTSGMLQNSARLDLEDEERELLKLQDDEDLARELMKESEDWPREEAVPSSIGYHSGPLTEEEQEDLQILGDIAALDDGSSSDSDFDSAIKKTIEAPSSRHYSTNKAVNSVSPLTFKTPESQNESNEFLPNDVVYEVILEKDSTGCGIVAQPTSVEQAHKGVYIQEVVQDSPADKGGILAPGDKILEVAGHNVSGKDSREVQELMDRAPNLTTVKVSRSMEKDSEIMERKKRTVESKRRPYEEVKTENNQRAERNNPSVPLSVLIPKAPTESTPPLEDLQIVPPPPPLNLSMDNSESNTQSDVDSDVLDSSRSDVDNFHRNTETFAIHDPLPVATQPEKQSPVRDVVKTAPKQQHARGSEWKDGGDDEKPSRVDMSSVTSDTLKLDGSSEFDEKLYELKHELDRQLATEDASPNTLSKSSDSSSTDSVVQSPRKILESISKKTRNESSDEDDDEANEEGEIGGVEDEEDAEHDDDDNVVVTMYGDEPVKDEKPSVKPKRKKKTKKMPDEEILDPFEPVLLNVILKRERDGFGFTVAGGVSTGGCYIKQLVGEPAISDGRLRPGDKILQVNGQDTTSLGHVETVTVLRQLADVARLRLLRFPSTMETQQRVQAAQTEEENQAQAQLASANPETKPAESETSEESEVKGQAEQSVQELAKALDTPKAIIHPYDYKGSLTAKAGVAKGARDSDQDEADGQDQPQESGDFQVELTRPADIQAVLGITLAQKVRHGQPLICVKRLKAGGVASWDGRLRRGDVILQVNDTPFTGLTVRQAVSYLRSAGETVVLTVSRSERDDVSVGSGDESHHDDEHEPAQETPVVGVAEDDDISGLAEEAVSLLTDRSASRVSEQYDSFRKPLTDDVPVILSEEWMNELPLLRMAVDRGKEYSRTMLQNLADLVESGEPNEAFKRIRQMKESGPCSVGNLPENKPKNRYRNVLPYDANRVKLSSRGEDKEYINASLIEMPLVTYATNTTSDGEGDDQAHQSLASNDLSSVSGKSGKCLKYFACQGPVEGTVSDLWSLVWQEQVHVVAMLTQIQEGGKLKCHLYWPRNKGDVLSVDDGALLVKHVRSYSLQDIEVVHLLMEEASTGMRQEVVLLQYKGWPDHGAPDSALPLLKLLQVIHLLENGSPPVIHCSAGIGRTGALIAIDVALACIEHGVEFNLHNIVTKLRTQRHGMVQTTDQFLFCYTACMEALLSMDLT